MRRAILSIARKNGKTALIAALVLTHLVGPEQVENGEIYSAANDREQAAQVYKVAAQIVRADPELAAMVKCVDSTKHIACYSNGSFYKAVSAEAGTKHGLNPSLVIFDELAQAKNRELYDVLDTSMGARTEPLFITISTQSNDPEHILSKLIDDGISSNDPTIVCHLYEVPEGTEKNPGPDIWKEKTWRLANPALGDFRSLADMRSLAAKAQRMPSEEPKFRNLYLNQRVSPHSPLISRAEWKACEAEVDIPDGSSVYLALDLSSTNDLSALVMGTVDEPTRVRAHFWKPEALLEEHSKRDFGGGNLRYLEWKKAGFLETTEGKSINPQAIALRIAELCSRYKVAGLAYDRWRIDTLRRELDAIELASYVDTSSDGADNQGAGLRLVPWGQGFKDMAPAVDAFERAVIDSKLEHPGNQVLTWNVGNARAVTDPAGNRKVDKDKARFRIDGAVALVMLMGLKARDRAGDEGGSFDDYLASLT